MVYTQHYDSPLGGVTLAGDGDALVGLWFDGQKHFGAGLGEEREERSLPVFGEAVRWLDLYFGGKTPDFTPKLALRSTPFRMDVWDLLLTVPYGRTVTYGELARRLGGTSARAMGGAVSRNPVSLIVPCHRVVGSGGILTGYAGGLDRKRYLLLLEQGEIPVCPVT